MSLETGQLFTGAEGKALRNTGKNCWHLTYSDGNPDPLKRVEVLVHGFISFDDKDMLKKYFASELREISLAKLGIE